MWRSLVFQVLPSLFGTEFSFLTAPVDLVPPTINFIGQFIRLARSFILMALPTPLTHLRLAVLTAQDIIAVI